MPRFKHQSRLYEAAERFTQAALRTHRSLFTPDHAIWSPSVIDDLYTHLIRHPNTSHASFEAKLQRQIRQSPAETIQLAGELLYIHLLIARRDEISPSRKRELITTVLSWSPIPVQIPADLDQALEEGIAPTGTAFKSYRAAQIQLLLEFAHEWKSFARAKQQQLLNDPWMFKEMLFALPHHSAYPQREALLHLVHPDTFEPILLREHKREIVQHFAHLIREPTPTKQPDVDRQLAQIRQQLEPSYGSDFSFYDASLRSLWQNRPSVVSLRASLLPRSLGEHLHPYIQLAIQLGVSAYTPDEIASLQYTPLDPQHLVTDLLLLRLLEPIEDGRFRRWAHLSDATPEHLMRYAALTLLVPLGDERYTLPLLDAPADSQPRPFHEWPLNGAILTWYEEAGLVSLDPEAATAVFLPDALEPLLAFTPTAQALTTFLTYLEEVRTSKQAVLPTELAFGALPLIDSSLLQARIAEIQRDLLIDRLTLLRIYRSLVAGRHLILTGPPGTGKTHLARLLPRIFWRDTHQQILLTMSTDPTLPPTAPPVETMVQREGYAVEVVTATEAWRVWHVIGGIVPSVQDQGSERQLSYRVRHGCFTRALLRNYADYDGERIPAVLCRQEYRDALQQTYRGYWLVIDEFTRAPIDAAFGSLLTTLGGQPDAALRVPIDEGVDVPVPLPADFRIIGTANSFDRHFLNQLSEGMKRRFAFIEILPPGDAYGEMEQALAIYRVLLRLEAQGIPGITVDRESGKARWFSKLTVSRVEQFEHPQILVRYTLTCHDVELEEALRSFWRIFRAIRIYRQLGTAQAEMVYAALLMGYSAGMPWAEALDTALADELAEQLHVARRDHQEVLLAYLAHAADAEAFAAQVQALLSDLLIPRQMAHLSLLKAYGLAGDDATGDSPIDETDLVSLRVEHLVRLFDLGTPLIISAHGFFARRLSSFLRERGG